MAVDLGLALQPDPTRLSLPAFLEDVCERHAGRVALVARERTWTFDRLHAEAHALARGLVGAGVGKGTRVALLMGNRPEWAAAAFAVALVGGVLVPVNTFATSAERDHILRHADAQFLLLQRRMHERRFLDELLGDHDALLEAEPGRIRCASLPHLRRVFCFGLADSSMAIEPWGALETHGGDVPPSLVASLAGETRPEDDALIIYTSGTTALPKGILHAQRAPVIQSWRFAEYMKLGPEDRVLTAQPFFWTAGIAMSLGASLAAGAPLVLEEVFDPERALALVELHRITALHAWPHQEKAMAEHPSATRRDLTSLRKIEFGSPLAKHAGLERDAWGTYGSYGLSETFTLASALPADAAPEDRRDTSGRPLPGMQLRIVDPQTGQPLAAQRGAEASGEIAVKGATLMKGYTKVPPELVFDADGYFHTQDGGSFREDGLLLWSGRLDNLIKTGGANVSPVEIESGLTRYPGVEVAAAVGVAHPTLGEIVVLCVVPSPGAAPDPAAIRAHLRERMAPYKVPKVVLSLAADEVSYTGNRKVQVAPLRETALRKLAEGGHEVAGHRYGGAAGAGAPGEET